MKILLVDDHALFREGIALLLRRLTDTLEIVEAANCGDAFRLIDDVDLVLMDLGLPGVSGLDGIAALRDRRPDIPIVALSSSDDKETVLKALDLGAMGFIPKSSSSDVMIGAIKLVLSKGIYLPPAVFLGERYLARSHNGAVLKADPGGGPHTVTPAELGLTERQSEVLYLILQGKSAKIISRELGLSTNTVKSHTSAVLRALKVTTRTQAVVVAGRLGLTFDRASQA
jgi:DNA-binding NarL/FixJ family response regulator